MKSKKIKKTLIIFLLFSFCTQDVNINENSLQEISDISEQPTSSSTTSTTLDTDLAWDNFLNAWEKNLKNPIELSFQENIVNAYFQNQWQWKGEKNNPEDEFLYQIEVNGKSCTRIWNSMGWALLDSTHPLEDDYRSSHTYKCDEEGETFLFGEPFYYDNNWWIYQNTDWSWDNFECDDPCGSVAQNYASLFVIENSQELRDFSFRNALIHNQLFNDSINKRGVIRRSTNEEISMINTSEKFYTEKIIQPQHEYSDSFYYDIKIPYLNSETQCAEIANQRIDNIVNELVDDKKSVLDITTPEEAQEEWGGFNESLSVSYDVLEISEYVISIFVSNTTYSTGAAHQQTFTQPINIYVPDCTDFDFHKLFDATLNNFTYTYEDVLMVEMKNQLCAQFELKSECDNFLSYIDSFPTLTELQECCNALGINEFGLFVQFWSYEVSSFAEGSELILVPWKSMELILDKNSLYKNMLEDYSSRTWLSTEYEETWSIYEDK